MGDKSDDKSSSSVHNKHVQIPSHPTTSTAAFAETGKSSKCLVSWSSKWVIDSGASDHMTGNSNLLSDFSRHAP